VLELIDIGVGSRHVEQYSGAFIVLGESRQSISSIDVNTHDLSLNYKIVGLDREP
jgi:hypothetical protein